MPKLKCTCDHIIGLGQIPSPHQYLIISDVEYDRFEGQVDAEVVYGAMKIIVKCSNCERLHIFWNGFNNPPMIYTPNE